MARITVTPSFLAWQASEISRSSATRQQPLLDLVPQLVELMALRDRACCSTAGCAGIVSMVVAGQSRISARSAVGRSAMSRSGQITAETALEGFYVLRTTRGEDQLTSQEQGAERAPIAVSDDVRTFACDQIRFDPARRAWRGSVKLLGRLGPRRWRGKPCLW
jgi:hypothetical protein